MVESSGRNVFYLGTNNSCTKNSSVTFHNYNLLRIIKYLPDLCYDNSIRFHERIDGMKITLAQAINLLSSLHKKVGELRSEFFTVHVMEVPKGETYTPYERTVEVVLGELSEVQRDILDLKEIIQQANLKNLVEWDGSPISMVRAIETAKQLRERLNLLKTLAATKKREYQVQHHSGTIMEQIALFDPAAIQKTG